MESSQKREIISVIRARKLQALTFILQILSMISVLAISINVNKIIDNSKQEQLFDKKRLFMTLFSIIIYIIITFITPFLYKLLFMISEKRLHLYLVKKVTSKPIVFFSQYETGYVQSIIKNTAGDVSSFYATYWMDLLINILSVVSYVTLIFYYSWRLSLIAIFLILLLIFLTNRVVVKQTKIYKDCKIGEGAMQNGLLEVIKNVGIMQMLDEKQYFQSKYETIYQDKWYKNLFKWKFLEALYTTLYATILYVLPLLVLVLGLVFNNFFAISVGATVSIYTILSTLQEPIRQLATVFSNYKKNKANLELLSPFMDLENANLEKLTDFSKLSFSSNGVLFNNKMILTNFNLIVDKGDFIVLHGMSGNGKTTIFKNIVKQMNNENIDVKIDGMNISKLDVFPSILMVSQQSQLFYGTIFDNICCGKEYTLEERKNIYKICLLDKFIEQYGEDKSIDNLSSNISGGEIQRICIARILLRKPKLLLLDEITSALDDNTATQIAKNIYEYVKENKITVLAISHKAEFDQFANKVIEV